MKCYRGGIRFFGKLLFKFMRARVFNALRFMLQLCFCGDLCFCDVLDLIVSWLVVVFFFSGMYFSWSSECCLFRDF